MNEMDRIFNDIVEEVRQAFPKCDEGNIEEISNHLFLARTDGREMTPEEALKEIEEDCSIENLEKAGIIFSDELVKGSDNGVAYLEVDTELVKEAKRRKAIREFDRALKEFDRKFHGTRQDEQKISQYVLVEHAAGAFCYFSGADFVTKTGLNKPTERNGFVCIELPDKHLLVSGEAAGNLANMIRYADQVSISVTRKGKIRLLASVRNLWIEEKK